MLRHLQPQDIEDKLHDTFLIVVQAIRRGDIREPMRLMGYTRTVVRRLVALHIEQRVEERRDLNSSEYKGYEQRDNPEETVFFRQRNQILEQVLQELSDRDREILTRFYIREQGSEQICEEMALSETQFRLLKTRAKNRFGELGRKKLAQRETGRTSGRAAAASA